MTLSRLGLQGAVRRVATATVTAPNVIRGSLVQRHSWMRASQSLQLPKPSGFRPFSSQGALRDAEKPALPLGMLTCSPHASPIAGYNLVWGCVSPPMGTLFSGPAFSSTARISCAGSRAHPKRPGPAGHGSSSHRMVTGPPAIDRGIEHPASLGDILSPNVIAFRTMDTRALNVPKLTHDKVTGQLPGGQEAKPPGMANMNPPPSGKR